MSATPTPAQAGTPIDREVVLQAHSLLLKGQVLQAQHLLNDAIDNRDVKVPLQPLGDIEAFGREFRTLCIKHQVVACAFVADPPAAGSKLSRISACGDEALCNYFSKKLRDAA